MTIEEQLSMNPYQFKYEKGEIVILKSPEELDRINAMLFDASPEFDYNITKWYLSTDKEGLLQNTSLTVESQVSWHMGWPFYGVARVDNKHFYIAEFYLMKG